MPRKTAVPAAGDWVTEASWQLSVTVAAPVMSGMSAAQKALTETGVVGAQASKTGAVVSLTVKVVEHVVVLPAASATVMVTVVAPSGAAKPAAGDWVTEVTPQLSVAETPDVKSGSEAVQLAPAEPVCAVAQEVMLGAVVSLTVRVAVHCELLPATSVAVRMIVVAPTPTEVPTAGDCVTVTVLQLSRATTPPVKSGTRAEQLARAESVWSAAQAEMTGAVVSLTVKVTWCEVELLLPSATVIVTVVTPRPTGVPAVGTCVTVTAVQLSVATTCDA